MEREAGGEAASMQRVARVLVTGGKRPLLLLLGTDETAIKRSGAVRVGAG